MKQATSLASISLALVTLAVTACGGSGRTAAETLSISSGAFTSDVRSFRGTFEAMADSHGVRTTISETFEYEAPSTLHLKGGAPGQDSEMLVVPEETYIRVPGEDWLAVGSSPGDSSADTFRKYLDNRGVIGYTNLIRRLERPHQASDVKIEGVSYHRLEGEVQYADLAEDVTQVLPEPALLAEADRLLEPVQIRLWLEKESLLPRRLQGSMSFSLEGSTISLDFTQEFLDYNKPLSVPTPPTKAEPLRSVLGLRCSYASRFLREKYQLPEGKGCVVLRVDDNSAAQSAGFRIGDKIIGLDGIPITSGRQFTFLFEDSPGAPSHEFRIRRGNEEMKLAVTLGPRADLPQEDPYFYYLRAKADTDPKDPSKVIEDYTRAIGLEPDFDLAYLYRGVDKLRLDSAAAEADFAKALDLDPGLTEAHRQLAEVLLQKGDVAGAFEHINRSLELNHCGERVESWDLDCGEDLTVRRTFYFDRLDPGDDVAAEADINAAAGVEFMEPAIAYDRFRLAFVRGDDVAARQRAKEWIRTAPNVIWPNQGIDKQNVSDALNDADTTVFRYLLPTWFYSSNLYDAPSQPYPGGKAFISGTSFVFVAEVPGLAGGEKLAWTLKRGDYRLASGQDTNQFVDRFQVFVGGMRPLPPGHYQFDLLVNGQPSYSASVDVP